MKGKSIIEIEGIVSASLLSPKGEVKWKEKKKNTFTDAGRNWLAHLISYNLLSSPPGTDENPNSKRRYDGVRYVMVGTGGVTPTPSVASLDKPIAYDSNGNYLKQIQAPNELPSTGTSALFRAVFGLDELSFNGGVNITEAGLFPSGHKSSPLNPSIATHTPIAYTTFTTPIPKTSDYILMIEWEIRF